MKVGDLVTPYDRSDKFGVIVDIMLNEEVDRFDTGEVFVILWHNGQLQEHKRWDLTYVGVLELINENR